MRLLRGWYSETLPHREGHHLDFSVHYREVDVTIWTHAIGGLKRKRLHPGGEAKRAKSNLTGVSDTYEQEALMSIPVWVLLGFAVWPLLTLIGSLGTYRLFRILSGRARPSDYSFPDLEKSDWHRRAMQDEADFQKMHSSHVFYGSFENGC